MTPTNSPRSLPTPFWSVRGCCCCCSACRTLAHDSGSRLYTLPPARPFAGQAGPPNTEQHKGAQTEGSWATSPYMWRQVAAKAITLADGSQRATISATSEGKLSHPPSAFSIFSSNNDFKDEYFSCRGIGQTSLPPATTNHHCRRQPSRRFLHVQATSTTQPQHSHDVQCVVRELWAKRPNDTWPKCPVRFDTIKMFARGPRLSPTSDVSISVSVSWQLNDTLDNSHAQCGQGERTHSAGACTAAYGPLQRHGGGGRQVNLQRIRVLLAAGLFSNEHRTGPAVRNGDSGINNDLPPCASKVVGELAWQ